MIEKREQGLDSGQCDEYHLLSVLRWNLDYLPTHRTTPYHYTLGWRSVRSAVARTAHRPTGSRSRCYAPSQRRPLRGHGRLSRSIKFTPYIDEKSWRKDSHGGDHDRLICVRLTGKELLEVLYGMIWN